MIKCKKCTLKIALKGYCARGLQNKVFVLSYKGKKRRKCVRMIQPINALTPRAGFRGSNETYKMGTSKLTAPGAVANAVGVALAAGGLTTTVARAYTKSWSQAGVLGLFGAFLTMFFMTPHLIDKVGLSKMSKKPQAELVAKYDAQKVASKAQEFLRPAKKLVQFRSEQA